ncbi:MAG: cadmium-translocating P-type ATPase [Clostridia bacterium]|nr:cadmium-translocating P-type ATPase [Clostridia bacterium]
MLQGVVRVSCHCHEHEHHHHQEHGHEEGNALVLWRAVAAAALVVLALLMKGWVSVALFAAAYLIAGYDVLLTALRNICKGKIFDENFLMAVASLGAMLMGEYAEGVAVLALYQVGEWFQDRAVDKSRASISALMDIRPDCANRLAKGQFSRVSPEEVAVGEMILVRPGEKIPLDGVVEEGVSSLNTAALTGESLPRDVQAGDSVLSGSVNLSGELTVRVTAAYGESTVAKILRLVESSGQRKARAEQFITRFARVYTPLVCLAAALLAVVPSLLDGQWLVWIHRALTFLVISCPCALVISVPLTFFSGIGGASRKGILIKGANYMETLARLDTVVFDKTGTLTRGVFTVTKVVPAVGTEQELLALAAHAESGSNHPIARSVEAAWGGEIDRERIDSVEEIAGQGMAVTVDGRRVHAGNHRLMEAAGLNAPHVEETGTVVHVAADGVYQGYLVIEDEMKPTSAQAVKELKEAGVRRLVMLTGDRKAAAEGIAAALGLTETHAELLPGDKVTHLESLLGSGKVAFVGDGINDAPVLRRADVGIAMGGVGSDAAIEAADVVLMDDDPAKLPRAIRHSRKTMSIVRQNIAFALGVKLAVMLLGALGIADMWMAVFADVGVAMLAVLNAMRAMK